MKRRGTWAGVLGICGALIVQGGAAAAEPVDRAVWLLDEPGVPTTAVDSSGFGNHGTNYNIVGTGSGYQFNGTNSRVVVADSGSLDPGTANFAFGATLVMVTPPVKGETYDVLRKGLSSTKGGEFKLEITHVSGKARARCVVTDANKVRVAVVAPTSLADGVPHSVTCSRTSRTVSVTIDSLAPRTKTVAALGSVANSSKLALGAKAENTTDSGFDWYLGVINDAWVRVG